MQTSRFTMIDEGFTCAVCGAVVPILRRTARDHCNICLCSLHVDNNPGDRECDCGGILEPRNVIPHKKGHQLVYVCEKCGEEKRNIAAEDDNFEKILEIVKNGVYYVKKI